MPNGGLYDPNLVSSDTTTEEVYNLLPAETESKESGKAHGQGGAMDTVSDASPDEASNAQKQAEMKVKIVQAANAARMMGKLSAGMERLAGEAIRSKVDWRAVLRNFLTERTKTDWTYAKPKRRFLAEDLYLPGLTGEKLESITIAVDCSGSISQETLNLFAAEIKGIIEDTKPSLVHVLYFDAIVLRHDTYTSDDTIELKPIGGGGTDFRPIFEYVESHDLNPTACIILTDLEGSFGEAPSFPTLWASTNPTEYQAPYGETVRIED